jgi:hypothetical protein
LINKDLLFLTIRKFSPVRKDRLFYNQFEYCIGFYLEEASCLRYLDHAQIDDLIERRRHWQEIAQQRWVNGSQAHGMIFRRRYRAITKKTVEDLHNVAEQLLNTTAEYKLVVTTDQGYVYTNSLALIDTLDALPVLIHKSFAQAVIARAKNTVQLKNPQHQFRSYFRLTKLTLQQKDHLMDFLYNQRGHVRVSPALQRWIDQPFNRTQDYFFVDHNTESWLTMLNLVQPGIIRKTMHIIPAK